MKTSNRITRLADDLAGYWTEPVLEILKTTGHAQASVQSEIETWHTLSAALQARLRDQRGHGATASLSVVKEQVFAQAISDLARKCNWNVEGIRPSTKNGPSTAAEHRLFHLLVDERTARSPVHSARQTDFVPRLQLAAVAG